MDLAEFNSHRTSIETSRGEVTYVDIGEGPVALFVHGVLMSSYLWHKAVGELSAERRCVALDLPGHGRTQIPGGMELTDLADLIEDFCVALELESVDLVANDTGGGVCQIFAARHPERLHTLTFTNCDVHDQMPPPAFQTAVDAARKGEMAPALVAMYADPDRAREALRQGYEHPENLSDEQVREFFGPFAEPEGARGGERSVVALNAEALIAVEPELAGLDVPTLIAWGTGDIFFHVKWARWLRDTIKGASDVVEIPGGKLFWPDERADELVPLVREHWAATSPAGA
jgi:pimeloyl-ACP methyl ester carboxylesterase